MDSHQNSAQIIKQMNQRLAKDYAEDLVQKILSTLNKDSKKFVWTPDLD